MNNEEIKAYYIALDKLNSEYKNQRDSKMNKLPRKVRRVLDLVMHLKVGQIRSIAKYKAISTRLKKKYPDSDNDMPDYIDEYYERPELNSSRIAVYSCITGDYDDYWMPFFFPPNVDYYLFSDKENLDPLDCVSVREIPDNLRTMSNSMINRYIKMHPHEFFCEYDYSIYLDGTVQVISDIRQWIVPASHSKTGIAMHLHSSRNCIYDEAEVCIKLGKGNKKGIRELINKYKRYGMPRHYGMLEATAIVTDLKATISKTILNEWYAEFCNNNSGRDQLSLPYILWKNGLSVSDVGLLGHNIKDSSIINVSSGHK